MTPTSISPRFPPRLASVFGFVWLALAAGCGDGSTKIFDGGQDATDGAIADAGSHDAAKDLVADGAADAADTFDASDATDAATCTLPGTYRFGFVGGLVEFTYESTIAPPDHYRHVRTGLPGEGSPMVECSPAFPPCGSPDAISVPDVVRDLADADVQAALAQTTPPLYGADSRPLDGEVYSVMRADGHGLLVGDPCRAPAVDCHAVPHGVQVLVDQLRALDAAQTAKAECASVRSP